MESSKIYLCKADCAILGNISGLKPETCSLKKHAVEQWELTFEVERYTNDNTCELNQSDYYDSIDTMMRLYLDGKDQIFFVIDSEPVIKGEGLQEIKIVTAHSIECELNIFYLKNFKINCGTKDSQEYLSTDSNGNFNNINPYTSLPYEYISLINYDNPQLSLLHLALQGTGWTVADNIDKEICEIKKSFDISNTNIYSFFMGVIPSSASVIFQFDRKYKKVSLVKADNFGKDTGIFVTMRNLMNSFEITSSSNDDLITKLVPTGANNLGIEQVNFGNGYITDLDYIMNTINEYGDYKYVSKELHDKYVLWKNYRETEKVLFSRKQYTRRELYTELSRLYNQTVLDIGEIKNRVPNDGVLTDYKTFSLEELKLHLNAFNKALVSLTTLYKNEYDVTEIGDAPNYIPTPSSAVNIKDTPYWHDFYAYKESIIPQIEEALKMYCQTDSNGNLVTDINGHFIEMEFGNPAYYAEPSIVKEVDSYKYEWSLYGLDELESKKKAWCEVANLLFNECFIMSGTITAPTAYRTPDDNGWNNLSDTQKKEFSSKSAYIDKLNQYLDYMSFDIRDNSLTKTKCKGIIRQCDDAIILRQNEISSLENLQNDYQAQRKELADSVSMENFKINGVLLFSKKDLNVIHSMIREQEYNNSNILTTNLDNIVTSVAAQEELYQAATEELYKLSQPQYSFNTEMDNLYALEEFQCYHDDFEVGNFIRAGFEIHEELFDNKFIKLRLMSITYNPLDISDQNISVEFSTMTKELNEVSDLASLLGENSTSSGGISSGSSSSGGTYGNNDANVQMSNNMINALLSTELFGTTVTDVILDSIKGNKGNFNILLSHSGVFDSLEAGQIKISGECLFDIIKSSNYVDGKSGSMMDLTDGSFSFAAGALTYNPQSGLIIKGMASDDSLQSLIDGLTKGTTIIDGSCITTGFFKSENWNGSTSNPIGNTTGSIICLSDGKFNFGGGNLKWDGTNLLINGNGKFTGEIIGTSGTFNGNITATTLTANQSGTIAGWKIDSNGFHRDNEDQTFSQSITSNGISISDFFFIQPNGFTVTDSEYYERLRSYHWAGNEELNPPITLFGYELQTANQDSYIRLYSFGNKPQKIAITARLSKDSSLQNYEDKTINIIVSDSMIRKNINNYMEIYVKIDDIINGYYLDDVSRYPRAVIIIDSLGLYDTTNKRIGIFKIDVCAYNNEITRIIFFNNIKSDSDFIINTLFSQISLKTIDIHPLGINAFDNFKFNIFPNNNANIDPNVTISKDILKHYGVYNNTASSGSQLRISEDGTIQRYSSSSKRYKRDITSNIPGELNPEKLYDLDVVSYKYNDNYLSSTDQRYKHNILGFIAEDVYEKYPEACNLNKDGNPEMWEVNILFPAALKLIQEQHKEIQKLHEDVESMKQQFQELKMCNFN